MNRSIVLLSGGLDSSVNLAQAVLETKVCLTLTIDYGQKSALREIAAARSLADFYGVSHQVIRLPFLEDITNTSLVNKEQSVPKPDLKALDTDAAVETAESVWVPNRNGLFVNIAACFAESMKCGQIITGFNAEEAATFPDNSPEFIQHANMLFKYSTLYNLHLMSYTIKMNKQQIVDLGKKLQLPFEMIWSCYLGEEKPCGSCESCLRLKRCLD